MAKRLVLLGAGPTHVQLLRQLAKQAGTGQTASKLATANAQIIWVSAPTQAVDATRVKALVAGRCTMDDCTTELAPLLAAAQVGHLARRVLALDADKRQVVLDDGARLSYDFLSLDSEPVQNRDQMEANMPGARANALFLRPTAGFFTLWPRVPALHASQALRVAVLCIAKQPATAGFDPAALELAFALRQRLRGAAITLVTGGTPQGESPGADSTAAALPDPLQAKLRKALWQRRIDVLPDAAIAIGRDQVHLQSGARLACDVPLVCGGEQAPEWLASSSLAMALGGQVSVDASGRSISHAQVFAAPPDASLADSKHLIQNLLAAVAGGKPVARRLQRRGLKVIALADGFGIAHRGRFGLTLPWLGAS